MGDHLLEHTKSGILGHSLSTCGQGTLDGKPAILMFRVAGVVCKSSQIPSSFNTHVTVSLYNVNLKLFLVGSYSPCPQAQHNTCSYPSLFSIPNMRLCNMDIKLCHTNMHGWHSASFVVRNQSLLLMVAMEEITNLSAVTTDLGLWGL